MKKGNYIPYDNWIKECGRGSPKNKGKGEETRVWKEKRNEIDG